jgi:hypothetical protein
MGNSFFLWGGRPALKNPYPWNELNFSELAGHAKPFNVLQIALDRARIQSMQ